MAPVGIVAVVSMKTIWKRNRAKTPTSYTSEPRKKPFMPNSPNGCPKRLTVNSLVSGGVPPSTATPPTPPICRAKPQIQ